MMTKHDLLAAIKDKSIRIRDVAEICVDDFGYDLDEVLNMKPSELIAKLEKDVNEGK